MVLYLLYLPYMQTVPTCGVEEALVSGTNPIPDAQITASSERNELHAPRYARINNTLEYGGWRASSLEEGAPEPRMYIQVCLVVTLIILSFIL